MKFLIVGLGNPGSKYENTRHNIGFKVIDQLAKSADKTFSTLKLAEHCELSFKGRKLILIKPTTFMNLSGKAVNYYAQQEKIPFENILVITDDLALPFGKLRLKEKGSAGGHNGLKDIEACLKTQNYARLRFGVGADFNKGKQVDYVLGEWSNDENLALPERIETAVEFIKSFVSIGPAMTMSQMNNK